MSAESEILAEVEALKGRFNDTRALYREVCALLFFRHGITPTANKLYQYVRKGTMSTPAEALAKFWEELRSKARVDIDHPDLPPEVKAVAAEAIAGLWQQATGAARSELAALRIELQADNLRAREQQAQAQREAAQVLETAERLRSDLAASLDTTSQTKVELEAERRAHAGAVARLQELQTQLENSRAQQQRLQEAFSADLAKARDAVDAADRRSAAAEKRVLMEIEQERQARSKADKQLEAARAQLASAEARERQTSLDHAQTAARLQVQCDAAAAALAALRAADESVRQELRDAREQLQVSQQEVARFRAEAQTLQTLLDRMSPAVGLPVPKPSKRKSAT